MNSSIQLRLTSFGLAIGVVAALITWAAYTTWQEVGLLEAFDSSKIASYETADHLQTTEDGIRALVKRKRIPHHRGAAGRLLFDRDELDAWVRSE